MLIAPALPEVIAIELREAFKSAPWRSVQQADASKYEAAFAHPHPLAPRPPEYYAASFSESKELAASGFVHRIYAEYLRPAIAEHLGISDSTSEELLAYRMIAGDHFRIHLDSYAARAGLVLYLNLAWRADWGGLLLRLTPHGIEATAPRWNTAVLMDHRTTPPPHCVTHITDFALEPRYTLVCLAK